MFKIRRLIHVSYSKNRDWKLVTANCTNTIGSHVCTCHTEYTGDGQTCSGDFKKFSSIPAIQGGE